MRNEDIFQRSRQWTDMSCRLILFPAADGCRTRIRYLNKIRSRPPADPRVRNSAVTNGIFVRFGNVELSHDELLSMAEREHNPQNI